MANKTALLVVDAQEYVTVREPYLIEVMRSIKTLIKAARSSSFPVFYSKDMSVSARQSKIHSMVSPHPGDVIIEKSEYSWGSAFHATHGNLIEELDARRHRQPDNLWLLY